MDLNKEINEFMRLRKDLVVKMIESMENYVKAVGDIISRNNPTDMHQINNKLTQINDILSKELIELTFNDTDDKILDKIMAIYDNWYIVDSIVKLFYDVYNNESYVASYLISMSSTFASNLALEKNKIKYYYDEYTMMSSEQDERIFNKIYSKNKDMNLLYNFAMKYENNINKFTNSLFGHIINNSEVFGKRIEAIIEKQKDSVLNCKRSENATYLILKSNLVPLTKFMQLHDLLSMLKIDGNDIEFIKNNQQEIGMIILNNSNKTPIEFNIKELVDHKYIIENGLNIPLEHPLNKRIIEKYDTLGILKVNDKDSLPFMQKYKGFTDNWYVIETINNGLHFRLLGKIGGQLFVNEKDIMNLVHGISTRPMKYNELQVSNIKTFGLDDKSENILRDYAEYIKNNESIEAMKNTIIDKFIDNYKKTIILPNINNISDFKNFIGDNNMLSAVLGEIYYLLNKKFTKTGDKLHEEYLLTHIVNSFEIIEKISKEFNHNIILEKLSERMFKETHRNDLGDKLMNIYKNIVKVTMDKMEKDGTLHKFILTSLKNYYFERKNFSL